jgi:hypothetical protein
VVNQPEGPATILQNVLNNVKQVIVGKDRQIRDILRVLDGWGTRTDRRRAWYWQNSACARDREIGDGRFSSSAVHAGPATIGHPWFLYFSSRHA